MPREGLDVAIFGGGIAGLWLLARLRRQGYVCRLFETGELGGGQTLASQGILHGGVKYALDGMINGVSRTVAAMPGRWQRCLEGTGELDLRDVQPLADHQHLWTSHQLASRLAGFFSSKALRGVLEALEPGQRPPPFDHPAFRGNLYRLNETVLDVSSLVASLARQNQAALARLEEDWRVRSDGDGVEVASSFGAWRARRVIFAAGEGNAELLSRVGLAQPCMQRRPLHMVALEGDLPLLFGHCLGSGPLPRFTLTSHPGEQGRIWYLGGALAESGVERSPEEQIRFAAAELADALPWLHLENLHWRTHRIDRAEAATLGRRRPDGIAAHVAGSVITVWPTKLVLAPALGDEVLELLQSRGVSPSGHGLPTTVANPPSLGTPWWGRP